MKFPKKTVLLGIILVVLVAAGIIIYKQVSTLNTYHRMVDEMTIADVDLNKIPDGVYRGSSEALLVGSEVAVTVSNHRITDIKLIRHKNGRGKPAEVIPERVVAVQSLKVDAVSGATSSSKVILKAIENALACGLKK